MKKIIPLVLFSVASIVGFAQDSKTNVDKLCGCYEVSFKYAETFSPDTSYKFRERETIENVTELALPIVNTPTKVVIQHLLVINDTMIVKHWREDWTYENPIQWIFKGDGVWQKVTLSASEVKGKWSQSVWEVSDAPRYQGSAAWQVVNNKTIWENTTDAPLPRREYTTRSDYNILNRTNRLVLTKNGYDHVQDNLKIQRTEGASDTIRVEESGLNRYVQQPEEKCTPALNYWKNYAPFWIAVEKIWEKYMDTHSQITLVESMGKGKSLNSELFRLSDSWKANKVSGNLDDVLRATILPHLQ
ncbi:DUF6607 family protein [Rhizosphaericola mali]|uniref:Uncharacterized protein n=1 Tax=Rhizosphaericola mali TaxID=2545455 RepID=A0A5P2GCY5_9BACT|nr:DUF6607 family protein [Rhizosphaericola mali]QES89451.1 hypothetical protein E0W69_012510 [Rhizosphaericola mali]